MKIHWSLSKKSSLQPRWITSEYAVRSLDASTRQSLTFFSSEVLSKIRDVDSLKIFLCAVTATFPAQTWHNASINNKTTLEPLCSQILHYFWVENVPYHTKPLCFQKFVSPFLKIDGAIWQWRKMFFAVSTECSLHL